MKAKEGEDAKQSPSTHFCLNKPLMLHGLNQRPVLSRQTLKPPLATGHLAAGNKTGCLSYLPDRISELDVLVSFGAASPFP